MASDQELLETALAYHNDGRLEEAARIYQCLLLDHPDHPDGLYLLGCLKQQLGDYSEAVNLLSRAVTLERGQPEYLYALGLALTANANHTLAVQSFEQAIEAAPNHVGAWAALGRALREAPDAKRRALECIYKAFQLAPEDVAVASDLGRCLLEMGRPAQAARVYQHIAELNPQLASGWYGWGCAETALEEYAKAAECFDKALQLEPEWLEARHNLARSFYELGLVNQAYAQFRSCSEMLLEGSEQSLAMMAVIAPGASEVSPAEVLAVRSLWGARHAAGANSSPIIRERRAPLRVGYVSSYFQRDNWMKPVWGLINHHDRSQVQVHLFSDCGAAEIQHGYRPHPKDVFLTTLNLSNGEVAEVVRRHKIDVLVDLNGYSNLRRLPLFARRIAPVAVSWFNMYATSGLSGIDYLVGDDCVIRPEEEVCYSEKILRLQGSYLAFDVSYPVPEVTLEGRPLFTFGAFASQYKITDEVVTAWSRILQAAPGSLLLIKNRQMGTISGRESLQTRFAERGIGAERLRLEGPDDHFEFLRAYARVDVALDTFPYNGGTTTTEAIWQGVPVVAFQGDRWAARTSASILKAAGLNRFVASDVEGYVALAAKLASDPQERDVLAELRRGMRRNLLESPICDTNGLARQMEAFYARLCGHG